MADPTIDCLKTIFKNVSGFTRHFSFLPPHGVTLAPDEEFEIFGGISSMAGSKLADARKVDALLRSLTAGELTIKRGNGEILKDISTTLTQNLSLSNAILGVDDPCYGTPLPSPLFTLDPRVIRTIQPTNGFGTGSGPGGDIGDGDGLFRAYDVKERDLYGIADVFLARHFDSIKQGPVYVASALSSLPALHYDNVDDASVCVPYSSDVFIFPPRPGGTKHPLPNSHKWTVHLVASNFLLPGAGQLAGIFACVSLVNTTDAGNLLWFMAYDDAGTLAITSLAPGPIATTDVFTSVSPISNSDAFLLTLEFTSDPVVPFGPNSILKAWVNGSDPISVTSAVDNDPTEPYAGMLIAQLFGGVMGASYDISRLIIYGDAFNQTVLKETAESIATEFGFVLGNFDP